jgi:uncharacterized NAD(P)/FAD-binding protein YdhS
MTAGGRPSIAVIGAGFSGLMCAIHLLLKSLGDGPRIYLIEQSEAFGLGAAYATDSGRHVLNTRAGNMSVFPDHPRHFLEWLQAQPGSDGITAATFITRRTYGEYLQGILRDAACGAHAAGRLYLVPDEVVSLQRCAEGFALSLKVGKVLTVDAAILATGNAPPLAPDVPEPAFFESHRYIDDPWDPKAFAHVQPGDRILALGSGLTMVDVTLLLRSRRAIGPLIALSRRGQVPRAHAAPAPSIEAPALPPRLSQAVAAVRAAVRATEGQGGVWQQVMDALRPVSGAYWQTLPQETRRRFLRHLRPWWDVHRHRLAPQVAERITALIERDDLVIRRGRLVRAELAEDSDGFPVQVSWRPAGGGEPQAIGVHHVVNCMGPGGDPTRSHSPLIQGLLACGLARPDPLRLGLDVDGDGRVIASDGAAAPRLFTVGPPTRGVFWEATAVPDIRQYAHRLADTALASLRA